MIAQAAGPLEGLTPEGVLAVEGSGWNVWHDKAEMLAFATDAVVTLFLAALIAHHPVRRRDPATLQSVTLPRLFYLYAMPIRA